MPEEKKKIMTTDAGRPVGDNQNSLTVGPRGPVVFEDFLLFEKNGPFQPGKNSGARGAREGFRRLRAFCVYERGDHQIHDGQTVQYHRQEDPDFPTLFDGRRRKGFGGHSARPRVSR